MNKPELTLLYDGNCPFCLAALTRLGDVHHSRFAWLALFIGVIIWAPQDILIS